MLFEPPSHKVTKKHKVGFVKLCVLEALWLIFFESDSYRM